VEFRVIFYTKSGIVPAANFADKSIRSDGRELKAAAAINDILDPFA